MAMKLKKRMFLMLGTVAIFLVAIGTFKVRQIQAAIAQGAGFQPPPEAVTTIIARQEQWPATLSSIGTVVAVQGVTVSADLPGIVSEITFDSGKSVRAGDVLLRLDTREEQAQLVAAEAQDALAHANLKRMQGLLEQGIIAQADYDQAVAEHKQADARITELHATIDRKEIRAPFDGILGIRQVNLGQYLKAGDAVVPLQSMHPIYDDFSLPQQDVARVAAGREVRVTAGGKSDGELTGKITAIDSVVDPATRNVQVQATLANPQGRLRPGMFVNTEVILGDASAVVALPASAIDYAPYGDSVFVVSDLEGRNGLKYRGVRQQFVKLGGTHGDQVAVLSGLDAGSEVVTSGAFKLRNGAAIRVNNDVLPSNNPDPRPENN
jgi:membrane fusion protein (multidrug efflux system)